MSTQILEADLKDMTPQYFRQIVRQEKWTEWTSMACRGYAQANLAIVPKEIAFDFLMFCVRNPRPCPVLDVTDPGDPHPKLTAPEADLRTDLPKYRVYKKGELVDEPSNIIQYWRDDLVAFLLGCSFSFDWVLRDAKVQYRLLGAFSTNLPTVPAGIFHGPTVVTCRLVKGDRDAIRAIQLSSRHLFAHGAPVHVGDPKAIGIQDLYKPDMSRGDFFTGEPQQPDEIALYWACGITPQTVAMATKPSLMIAHSPGCMFVTDKLSAELAVL